MVWAREADLVRMKDGYNKSEHKMSEELWKLSAVKMAEGIRNRKFSCEEVVSSVTNRIQKLNPSLNAIVGDLNPTAVDLSLIHI